MYIINSNFALVKQVGDLSESRLGILKQHFNAMFPEIIRPNENTIMFKKAASALVIASDRIVFVTQGDMTELDIKKVAELLIQANEVLGLSEKSRISVTFEVTEATSQNTLEKSKTYLTDCSEILDAYGIGYRFMVNNGKYHGDVHIEPYIKDNQKVFYFVNLESVEQINSNDVSAFLDDVLLFFSEKVKLAASKIFSL